jgi:hypothetical protein
LREATFSSRSWQETEIYSGRGQTINIIFDLLTLINQKKMSLIDFFVENCSHCLHLAVCSIEGLLLLRVGLLEV